MSAKPDGLVTIEQIGEAIRKCAVAHPEYTSQKLLHPDAERLCEALAEMNCRRLSVISKSVFQDEHLDALMRWIEVVE